MNKKGLAKSIATQMNIPNILAYKFLKALENVIENELENKGEITLQGFGSFTPWEQVERTGRNPRTGEPYPICQRTSVKFKPGKFLLEALNKEKGRRSNEK